MLDDFETPSAWTLVASDDVKATLRPVDGERGRALCIDFDFGRVTGYVARAANAADRVSGALRVRAAGPRRLRRRTRCR